MVVVLHLAWAVGKRAAARQAHLERAFLVALVRVAIDARLLLFLFRSKAETGGGRDPDLPRSVVLFVTIRITISSVLIRMNCIKSETKKERRETRVAYLWLCGRECFENGEAVLMMVA